MLSKLERSRRAADLRKVPEQEIRERTYEVYRNLSDWLLTKTEDDVELVYNRLGRRRAEQGVALSALCWGIMMIERNLWDFLELEGMREKPLEILGSLELLHLLDQFFEKAVYYAILGYEGYWREKLAESSAAVARSA
ncbi:MAG: hypothetical protein ACHP7J_02820 [Terriglobales bacterium]